MGDAAMTPEKLREIRERADSTAKLIKLSGLQALHAKSDRAALLSLVDELAGALEIVAPLVQTADARKHGVTINLHPEEVGTICRAFASVGKEDGNG